MYDFQLQGGPIDSPAGCEEAFAHYGRAAAAWARLEAHMEVIIIHINKRDHSQELYDEHPASFENKIKTLKRWFNKHPVLLPHADDIREITSRAKVIGKEYRHFMMHCFFRSYDNATRTITLHKIAVLPDGNIRISLREQTLEQMAAFTDVCNTLNSYLGTVSRNLFQIDTLEQLRKHGTQAP